MSQTRTNFAAMTPTQIKVWSRDVWKTARDQSFVMQFAGTDINSPIYRVTELTKTTKGDRAVIPLVTDLEGDGVTGDHQLEGHEEPIKAYEEDITIDQLRNANTNTGRMADQKTIINFRTQSRDKLGYWLGNRMDQMGFLTVAGMDYRLRNDGGIRKGWEFTGGDWARMESGGSATHPEGYTLADLSFAADVTAPTANRYFRWDGAAKRLVAADTGAVESTDAISYQMLVEARAQMVTNYIRGVRTGKGGEVYHVWLHPKALAKLKLDPDFLANVRNAGARGKDNAVWTGAIETVDGLMIHEHRLSPNTLGATAGASANAATPGYKWGGDADQDGNAVLFLGAQALGLCTLGTPNWEEINHFDYRNRLGIAIDQIFGLRKPRFHSIYNGGVEDFGVMRVDVAI